MSSIKDIPRILADLRIVPSFGWVFCGFGLGGIDAWLNRQQEPHPTEFMRTVLNAGLLSFGLFFSSLAIFFLAGFLRHFPRFYKCVMRIYARYPQPLADSNFPTAARTLLRACSDGVLSWLLLHALAFAMSKRFLLGAIEGFSELSMLMRALVTPLAIGVCLLSCLERWQFKRPFSRMYAGGIGGAIVGMALPLIVFANRHYKAGHADASVGFALTLFSFFILAGLMAGTTGFGREIPRIAKTQTLGGNAAIPKQSRK